MAKKKRPAASAKGQTPIGQAFEIKARKVKSKLNTHNIKVAVKSKDINLEFTGTDAEVKKSVKNLKKILRGKR